MSPSFREYLETLTCEHNGRSDAGTFGVMLMTFSAHFFHEEARKLGLAINEGPRGSPLNVDGSLEAHHPVVRTSQSRLQSFIGPRADKL